MEGAEATPRDSTSSSSPRTATSAHSAAHLPAARARIPASARAGARGRSLHLCSNPTTCASAACAPPPARSTHDAARPAGARATGAAASPRPTRQPDRLARLASHLVQQRSSWMSALPGALGRAQPAARRRVANVRPGLLHRCPRCCSRRPTSHPLPSSATSGVLAVNPGRLTRKAAGGNYATICSRRAPRTRSLAAGAGGRRGGLKVPPPRRAAAGRRRLTVGLEGSARSERRACSPTPPAARPRPRAVVRRPLARPAARLRRPDAAGA